MFEFESQLQQLVHEKPEIVLSGIPEINPEYCPDTPMILSLGREIPLSSGPIDNLYIDTNAIVTFVECKRYGDSRIKREVYSQAINYASDLQNMMTHYTGEQFCDEFIKILKKGQDGKFDKFQDIVDLLSEDPLLSGKQSQDWQDQFIKRLEYNIKSGIFRIVIACAPSPSNVFAYSTIRNLIQLMNFSEAGNNKYDLILLDIREQGEQFCSKIIWRSYALLPQIPLLAETSRDTSSGIEDMKTRYKKLPDVEKQLLDELITFLNGNNVYLLENTVGFAAYSTKTKKSLYVLISVDQGSWKVIRHQIRSGEKLFRLVNEQQLSALLVDLDYNIIEKQTGKGDPMFDVEIEPHRETKMELIAQCIVNVLSEEYMGI